MPLSNFGYSCIYLTQQPSMQPSVITPSLSNQHSTVYVPPQILLGHARPTLTTALSPHAPIHYPPLPFTTMLIWPGLFRLASMGPSLALLDEWQHPSSRHSIALHIRDSLRVRKVHTTLGPLAAASVLLPSLTVSSCKLSRRLHLPKLS